MKVINIVTIELLRPSTDRLWVALIITSLLAWSASRLAADLPFHPNEQLLFVMMQSYQADEKGITHIPVARKQVVKIEFMPDGTGESQILKLTEDEQVSQRRLDSTIPQDGYNYYSVYAGELNGDKIVDFLVTIPTMGVGLAAAHSYNIILLSDGSAYTAWEIDGFSNAQASFFYNASTDSVSYLHTDLLFKTPEDDGNYWVYSMIDIYKSTMRVGKDWEPRLLRITTHTNNSHLRESETRLRGSLKAPRLKHVPPK